MTIIPAYPSESCFSGLETGRESEYSENMSTQEEAKILKKSVIWDSKSDLKVEK